jgi:ribosomal protein S18 acetylase RimI-like enzyme
MSELPESLFANPILTALQTRHRHFARWAGDACRYPGDVAPFAAVMAPGEKALRDLSSLLDEGESVWIVGENYLRVPELVFEAPLPCLQMVLEQGALPAATSEIERLTDDDAHDMVTLTDLAFPGFFRPRTCEMGAYYGVRRGGELIAMGGERLLLDGYSEISGLCTHPAHRGKGLAAGLIGHLARAHRSERVVSWLHVVSDNRHAIELYERVGFRRVREVVLWRVSRSARIFE